jgi:hypothetical protein
MRPCLLLIATASLTAAQLGAFPARADAIEDARTAVEACFDAVIDGAPVEDVKAGEIAIHRDKSPNLCAVTVTAGAPDEVRAAVLAAMAERSEGFVPARTVWDPGPLASRETYCSRPGRRALNFVVETAKPGASPVVVASVIEGRERDRRCDLDMGLQRP